MDCDFLSVVISRQQVEAGDITEPISCGSVHWHLFLSSRAFALRSSNPKVQQRIWNEQIGDYLLKRGFPAMNRFVNTPHAQKRKDSGSARG
jgi:hypothetical protein